MTRHVSMDGVYMSDDGMMGDSADYYNIGAEPVLMGAEPVMMGGMGLARSTSSAAKKAIAAKRKSTAKNAKVTRAAAKKVAKSKSSPAVKKEAQAIASAAAQLAERVKKLSMMAGVEPALMGDADFGEVQMYGEDDGMMGGAIDFLKTPTGMALGAIIAIVGFVAYQKYKK